MAVQPRSGPVFTAPATGQVLATVATASGEGFDPLVARARTAQRDWARLPYVERSQVFLRAAALTEVGAEP
ncbi:hypothetical protein WN71_026040 [Streptomyces mangrovisoli]|uniref:Aldehyde dehydrogenase domain-containing protein n=1 Tax=Streptomyces mangrovisoli TaxID=1428628 RepID=A0A1J4NRL0_9ACTN|nr:hypothetical protein WN71_026040 [Streptomyces mangrovisoli]